MRIIIVGAGIVGCALAYRLASGGHAVTVIEAGQSAGGGATGASFGWLNASFFADEAHFRLREAGLSAWRGLSEELNLPALNWSGALWWEEQGAALTALQTQLGALGYPVERITREAFADAEPAVVAPPQEALRFEIEGVAEPAHMADRLLKAALGHGAQVLFGLRAERVAAGRVETAQGVLHADQVVVATGTAAQALLVEAGHPLPMLQRPGVLLRTAPVPRRLAHILVTPEGEIRQDPEGRIVMPTAAGHQGDQSETVAALPELADAAMARLRHVIALPASASWAEAALAFRPVPEDGLPVVGALDEGLYVAVMHSGATLAAGVADLAAAELTGKASNRVSLLSPYRPRRFADA